MKKIFVYAALAASTLLVSKLNAQEVEKDPKIEILKASKEQVVAEEKAALKKEVEDINKRLEAKTISKTEAEVLKKAAAEKHALNIENKVAIIDNKMALLERNGKLKGDFDRNIFVLGFGNNDETGKTSLGIQINRKDTFKRKYDRRTTSEVVFSFGLNNAIIDGQSIDDSPYKIGGSRYAELGLVWGTRVFKESNWLRLKYGVSFQFNGLKMDDNQYLVDTGAQTELQEFPLDLDKSKFRMDNLVIPVHFEFGSSKKQVGDDYFRYNTNNSFKIGLGGYAGLNLSTRQKLKFEDENEDVKQKLKANYNTNNFIYGLSGYIGYGDISLYAKYDLNTIFKNNPTEQRNVSLGVRWDWD